MVNKSKAYIAPLVLEDIQEIPFKWVKNTYIFSDFNPLEPFLYVEINGKLDGVSREVVQNLYKFEEIKDIFSIGEDYLLSININSNFNYEYLLFKRGDYSWYTPKVKSKVVNYLTNNVNSRSLGLVDKIKSVFSRDPMLKKYYEDTLEVSLNTNAELASKMEEEKETFKSCDALKFERIEKIKL
jgi:hypothetical protein